MQHLSTNSDVSPSRLPAWLRRVVDYLCRRAEPRPGEELEPGVIVPPLHHPERLPEMLAAHGLMESVMACVDAATQQYMQRNCVVCPHGRTCDLHRGIGVSEALAPRYCRNIELIHKLQDRHVPAEILTIPRHVRHRRRPLLTPPPSPATADC